MQKRIRFKYGDKPEGTITEVISEEQEIVWVVWDDGHPASSFYMEDLEIIN